MSTPLGIPIPKMLPITGTWTFPFATYLMVLSQRVCAERVRSGVMIGDSSSLESDTTTDPLTLSTRAHQNFLENVPLALTLSAIAELNGADRKVLNYALGTLLVLRIAHVEFGLRGEGAKGMGRIVGFYGTSGIVLGLAGWAGWLVRGFSVR